MATARPASGAPRKGFLLPRSFRARPDSARPTEPADQAAPPAVPLVHRLRTSRGTAVRATAGAGLLLGVTAAVAGLTEAGAPPAGAGGLQAAQLSTTSATTDPLGDPALRQRSLASAARAQTQVDQARERAAQEAARSATRRAERAAAVAAQRREAAAVRARAAAKARAAAQRAAAARTPTGDARSIARQLLAARGWSGQFGCLDALWQRESNWNHRAMNPSSGAYGIPQSLPASKMASAGSDWRTNPATQIRWGLSYIASRYGTPCGAWGHSQSNGWY